MEKIQRKVIELAQTEKFKLKRIGWNSSGTLSLICEDPDSCLEVNELEAKSREIVLNINKDELEMLIKFIDKIRPEWKP